MKKLDLKELFPGKRKQSFHDDWFSRLLPSSDKNTKSKEERIEKIRSFLTGIWRRPEFQVIIFLIVSRLFLTIFTHYGMDFELYVEVAQRVLAGERLYTDITSTHMPLADLLYILMYFICPWRENIFALLIFLKLPFIISDIGIALAVMRIVENEIKKREYDNQVLDLVAFEKIRKKKLLAGYLIAFSLPLIIQTAGGRYDSILILCFAMAILSMQHNNYCGVAFFAALGSSAKYIGIIFIPFVMIWMKKEDILPFILGLLIGFLPIYPFLFTIPKDFISEILLRDGHIAFGFSLWHAIKIVLNGFKIKHINTIMDTYDTSDEPWFIQRLYLPMFVIIYLTIFILYIIRNRGKYKETSITDLTLVEQTNLVFIPLFIFALSFKALNLQVLAWFTPYFALKKRARMFFEYSGLTLIHGFAWIFYSAYNPLVFQQISNVSTGVNSFLNVLISRSAEFITKTIPAVVWVVLIFVTILWFLITTTYELVYSSKELLRKDKITSVT
jgi:hypothetical protein